jgi:hypothetical protein
MDQTILLPGGRDIQMKTWWTGNELGPYEMGLVDHRRSGDPRAGTFTMLRMSRKADFWGGVQTGTKTIDLGGSGPSRFVDLDNDGIPELVHWAESEPDARFVRDPNLPTLLSERTYRRTDRASSCSTGARCRRRTRRSCSSCARSRPGRRASRARW